MRNVKLKHIIHVVLVSIGVAWAGASQAAPTQAVGFKILSFGQYGVGGETRVYAPGVGGFRENETRHLIRQTSCISAQLGTLFGIVVRHTASDASLRVPVQMVVKHPPITKPDGTIQTSGSGRKTLLSEGLYLGWRFEEPYEMVPGIWTVQVHYNGKVVTEKKFTVVAEGRRCR